MLRLCDPAQPRTQRHFSKAVDRVASTSLLASAPLHDKARLLSISGKGAGAWLGVIPSEALGYVFSPREFSILLKWWCGMAVYDSVCACPGCGAAMDLRGYHALTCTHMGSFGVRHNALREIFLTFLHRAGITSAVREAPSLPTGSAARPADIFIPDFVPPKAACLDFAVTHPQQTNIIKCASVCAGAAAAQYEEAVKDMKFGAACEAAGLVLVPMVVETYGRWGERSAEAFQLVSKACASQASEKVAAAGAHIRHSLSVGLQRLNARILLARANPGAEIFMAPVDLDGGSGAAEFVAGRVDEVADEVAAALDEYLPPDEV